MMEASMSIRARTCLVLMTLVANSSLAARAFADPPGRVARVGFISGSASIRPATLEDWSPLSLNRPLTTGDHVWTDRDARAELQLGSTVIRIAPYTELSLLDLDDRTVQLRVTEGAVLVRTLRLDPGEVLELDTPTDAVSLVQPGLYRVDVAESGEASVVTVRRGHAALTLNDGQTLDVNERESIQVTGLGAATPEHRQAAPIDAFEDWSLARDRRAENVQAAQYVSPDMIGYQDLDPYGAWRVTAEYGPVWMPTVRAEWVPYRFGHWVWIEPWGWTWVDDAPWGFAPFHYGRWLRLSTGWAWVPGARAARPVYAPALVAFVGGNGWSASFAFGSAPVAWFPLGPREVFVPAYRVTPVYIQQVNVAHVTNINVTTITLTNIQYANRSVPGALTAVPRDAFVRAQPVATVALAIPREQAQAAPVVGTAPAVAPQATSLVRAGQGQTVAPPATLSTRPVLARRVPPTPPVAFAQRQPALNQQPGRPLDAQTAASLSSPTDLGRSPAHPLVRAVGQPQQSPASEQTTRPSAARQQGVRDAETPTGPAPHPPAPVRPAAPAALTAKDLAAQQQRERQVTNQRQTQERADLQTRHQQELQAASSSARSEIEQRHQAERQEMQHRHEQEHQVLQERHKDERKQQTGK